ncbi:hypothetical protein [Rhodococcus sp. LB1]|uniref:hypothetical protein n=1 Tax=Rhodococcus sp. LB1 TaxID=1807499 RepID=UPI0012E7EE50|nr:hypothetical protein [Rhodococcus sp. LB1]
MTNDVPGTDAHGPDDENTEADRFGGVVLHPRDKCAASDSYPCLRNISAGFVFQAVLRADNPAPPEYVTVWLPSHLHDPRLEVVISEWNMPVTGLASPVAQVRCPVSGRHGQNLVAGRIDGSHTYSLFEQHLGNSPASNEQESEMSEASIATARTIEELIDEYDQWRSVLDRDSDEFDTIAKIAALYRFAIANFNEPGSELLLRAIASIESVEKER